MGLLYLLMGIFSIKAQPLSTSACWTLMECSHSLSALFSKTFSLGSSEVFPSDIPWLHSFSYSRQQQMGREMVLCHPPGLQGQQPAPKICCKGFSSVLSTVLWVDSPTLHVCPVGLSNTKFLESKYQPQELKTLLKSLEAGSWGHIHSSRYVFCFSTETS